MSSLFEAYITNLGKYNEGRLVGETLKFPATTEEVQALLKRIGVDGVRYEEIFITSFDGDVLGLYDHLGEYESIDELNHLAHVLSDLDQSDASISIRSDLRLVVDLQNCIKAQQSRAYAQKVKISNLQQMAKTVAYIQENGFDTRENLQTTYDSITLQMHDARQKTKDTETQIKSVNEQIHYLGQYLSTKSTYNEFLKARFKGKFRKDHADEIEKHEKAAQILKAQNPDGSLPKMKDLKLEKERLLALKAAQYDTYTYYKDYQKELRTACANVDSILGQHHIRDHIQRTEQTL